MLLMDRAADLQWKEQFKDRLPAAMPFGIGVRGKRSFRFHYCRADISAPTRETRRSAAKPERPGIQLYPLN
jgi:hypothetical protein